MLPQHGPAPSPRVAPRRPATSCRARGVSAVSHAGAGSDRGHGMAALAERLRLRNSDAGGAIAAMRAGCGWRRSSHACVGAGFAVPLPHPGRPQPRQQLHHRRPRRRPVPRRRPGLPRRHVTVNGVFESRDDGAFAHPRRRHVGGMRYATGAMAASKSRLCVGERRERIWPRVRRRRSAGAARRAP